ncbi:MAG: hypothetical protein K9J37_09770 [Saprospiraceae bacterium]|nr:hypothetical protein [Saprospiraceae bacterium]MCF8250191.1 hypothetical protein [Saprospiraceae bacterium]MCF8280046.1 hypothetical protein [Bacteroidales bacterium]MCF8311999.1 hypothetical protein [Saprospiraceae bacterium]MCF8441096.1 hypothetical protein [Saprospiraceae bacterium]
MKTSTKALISIPVLAFFLYLAWACSYEKDYPYFTFVEMTFNNNSDSCKVKDIALIYRVRRDNNDTLQVFREILPGDSSYFQPDALDFRKMNYTCDCPGHVFQESRNVQLDTIGVNRILFDCD